MSVFLLRFYSAVCQVLLGSGRGWGSLPRISLYRFLQRDVELEVLF